MKRILFLLLTAALLISCDRNIVSYDQYNVALLINEGNDGNLNITGFNEDDMVYEDYSLRESNDTPLEGELQGIFIDDSSVGFLLTSDPDALATVSLSQFKIMEKSILFDLQRPTAYCFASSNLYILNRGEHPADTSFVSVYSTNGYKFVTKIDNINQGGNAIYVDRLFTYIGGKNGIEMYGNTSRTLDYTIEAPAEVMEFIPTMSNSIIVSLKDYGVGIFDTNSRKFKKIIEVPVGPKGRIVYGTSNTTLLTYSGDNVYLVDLESETYTTFHKGFQISGVGRSSNTKRVYVSEYKGDTMVILDSKGNEIERLCKNQTGDYSYIFSTRVIETPVE